MGPSVCAEREALLAFQRAIAGSAEGHALKFEVGGFLLGTTGSQVRIEAILPLAIEHRFGPAFWLSSADMDMAKREIRSAATGGGPAPIGHFRCQTEGEPEAGDIDHAIADLLPVAEPVLLLVSAARPWPMEVVIYRRMNGAWVPRLRTLADEIPLPPTVAPPAVSAAEPPAPPPFLHPTPAVRRMRRLELSVLLGVLGGVLLWNQVVRRRAPPPAATGPVAGIGLEAHAADGAITVRWDHTRAAILQGSSATLWIQDGVTQKQLSLNREQLLNGSVAYAPVSSRVEFRMEVYRDRQHFIGESVSVATDLARPASPAAHDSSPPAADNLQATSRVPPGIPTKVEPPVFVEVSVEAHRARGPKPMAMRFPAPPEPARNPMLAAPPPTTAQVQPIPEVLGAVLATQPAPRTEMQVSYVTATPVRKIRPAIPASLRGAINGVVSVSVKVMIDASGKVVSAAPVDTNTAAQKMLAPEAVQAARLWSFEPARRDGQPVSSESVLKFDFERQ